MALSLIKSEASQARLCRRKQKGLRSGETLKPGAAMQISRSTHNLQCRVLKLKHNGDC